MSLYSYLSNSQLTTFEIIMEVLKGAGVGNLFQHLAGEITEVSFAFNAQAISQSVQCFDNNPKCFRDWVIQMKLGTLLAYCLRQTFVGRFSCRYGNKVFFFF